jgi:hypothetical protein
MRRRKKNRNLKPQTRHSDKIIANYNKLYKIDDPEQLAWIFFPAKNAKNRRAAFIAIFFELRNSRHQRLDSFDFIAEKYGLSTSAVWKARTKMTRIGLIRKRGGQWHFSTVFSNALEKLIEHLEAYQTPVPQEDRNKVFIYVEVAKGEQRKENSN